VALSSTPHLLIAASGTGGHLFPALALAQELPDYQIEWLGVPNRLETTLVPKCYSLNTIAVEGFQQGLSLKTFSIAIRFITSVFRVRQLIREHHIDAVFTTGGYIAAPAILAARWESKPAIIHEANFIPGKVTRCLSRWCDKTALGFAGSARYLAKLDTSYVSTPVRPEFLEPQNLDLDIPDDVRLIVIVGGSQGAVAVNRLVRQAASAWLATGAYIVHLTGNNDPDVNSLEHPHYIALPFYEKMAGLLQRADLALARSGAGTLTELAVTGTPAFLIPYPYAAEDHQTYNARVFVNAGAAVMYQQSELTPTILEQTVLEWLQSPDMLENMSTKMQTLAVKDSAARLANLVRQTLES
jgi:UDP-N-acetylglucosamine--N-acetylmuramyl-(pentapeptide) pyrophosphoryl-undecaprenol N-acetylglucosamine transferase